MKKIMWAVIFVIFGVTAANAAAKKESPAVSADFQRTIYSCPMHPEVQSHKPSQCPKCGMDLEQVTA